MFFPSYEKDAEIVFGSKECTKPDPDTVSLPRKEYEKLIRESETLYTIRNIIQNCEKYAITDTIVAAFPWMIEMNDPAPDTTDEETKPDA